MRKHLFWIVELFIWLLVLFLIAGGIMLARHNYKKAFNTYQIFFTDVDGLITGSPVRLMGIQVGYISQINIVGEDVYVKFIITDPKVKLPYGSVATVEFSGLGGSKSLEIYPPKTKTNYATGLIVAQRPKRISDSLGLLNDMFNQIVEITYVVSSFMDKIGLIRHNDIKVERDPYETSEEILNFVNKRLDKMQEQSDIFSNKLEKIKKGYFYGNGYGKN